jgi:hypothetical protein
MKGGGYAMVAGIILGLLSVVGGSVQMNSTVRAVCEIEELKPEKNQKGAYRSWRCTLSRILTLLLPLEPPSTM